MFSKLKSNNKGYMLVEIILAFSIAFMLLYFIMDLVIKMKNTNDDLLVKTLVYTDQTIVSNGIMELAIEKKDKFNCESLKVESNVVKYDNEVIDVLSEYAKVDIDKIVCKDGLANKIVVQIPIIVEQLPDEDFSVDVDYRYGPNDTTSPECEFSVDTDGILTAKIWDVGDDGVEASGVESYQWDDGDIINNTDNILELNVNNNIEKNQYKIKITDNAGNIAEFVYSDKTSPSCTLNVSNGVISLSSSKDNGSDGNDASGIKSYQWKGENASSNYSSKNINSASTYTLSVKDYAGNSGTCNVVVVNRSRNEYCPNSGTPSTGCYHSSSYLSGAAGSCTCSQRVNGAGENVFGNCELSGSSIGCSCPSGTAVYTYNCYGVWSNKNVTDSPVVEYICPSGTKSTGNNYCYK